MRLTLPILALALLTAPRGGAAQTTIARWNFNSPAPDNNTATGVLTPSSGAGTLSLAGGVTGVFVPGTTDGSNTDNSALALQNFPTPGTHFNTAGFQVAFNPAGASYVQMLWRHCASPAANRFGRLEASFDGANWQYIRTLDFGYWLIGEGMVYSPQAQGIPVPVPTGSSAVYLRVVSTPSGSPSRYTPAYAPGMPSQYYYASPWWVDALEVRAVTPTPPIASSFLVNAFIYNTDVLIDPLQAVHDADQPLGDVVTLASINGPSEFQIYEGQLLFVPPHEFPEASRTFLCDYTVVDHFGLTASATVTVRVFNPAACTFTATPPAIAIRCYSPQRAANYLITASPPPGEGGTVLYQWFKSGPEGGGPLSEPTPEPSVHLTGLGTYRCVATRTGGSGGCGEAPIISNGVDVTADESSDPHADIGIQGGLYGQDNRWDNNDFISFIQLFYNQDPIADMGMQGGLFGQDNLWDNNDFIAFISYFFASCSD